MTEYEAVRDGGAGLIDLSSSRGRIRVSGSEATMFLNGLITNDVKNLAQNRWMPAVFPTVQGRLIGAVRVIRGSDPSLLIDTETASHDAVLKTISRFTLAGDFKVADVTDDVALLTLQGQGAAEILEKVLDKSFLDLPQNGVDEITSRSSAPVTLLKMALICLSTPRERLSSSKRSKGRAHSQSVRTPLRSCASKPASLALVSIWTIPTSFPKRTSMTR